MSLFKKNIWFLFYTVTVFFFILFGVFSYLSWKNIYKDYKTMQENTVKLIADSTHSLFKTQEIILNIVGNRFLEDEHYKHNPSAMTTLNAALSDSPSMEAIAIVTTGPIPFLVSSAVALSRFSASSRLFAIAASLQMSAPRLFIVFIIFTISPGCGICSKS